MKLEINLRDNKFACWVCHYSGSPLKLLKEYGKANQVKAYAKAMGFTYADQDLKKDTPLQLPTAYKAVLDHQDSLVGQHAYLWLNKLGVSDDAIYQNRVGFCEEGLYRNRVFIPSFDENGNLNYFVTRHLYEDKFKYLSCEDKKMSEVIFNELFIDWNRPAVLVESSKAYLKHFEHIDGLVCLNGTRISTRYKTFEKLVINQVPRVYIAFDAEADAEAMEAMTKFYEYGIETYFVQFENKIQPDQISSAEFEQAIKTATAFEKTDAIRNRIKHLV